jgi:hypothetical protein
MRILFFLAFVSILCSFGCGFISRPLPKGLPSAEAEILTDSIFRHLNKNAWDTTRFISWTYAGRNQFVWDKTMNKVKVSSKKGTVTYLDLQTLKAIGFDKKGKTLSGKSLEKARNHAWKAFCNDGFWLSAPFKLRDSGTTRSIVFTDSLGNLTSTGNKNLLVQYKSGGVTPGDSYLWLLSKNGKPYAWRMWVKIIPIGGVWSTWENWVVSPNGFHIATSHKIANTVNSKVTNLKSGQTFESVGENKATFETNFSKIN